MQLNTNIKERVTKQGYGYVSDAARKRQTLKHSSASLSSLQANTRTDSLSRSFPKCEAVSEIAMRIESEPSCKTNKFGNLLGWGFEWLNLSGL